MEKTRGYQFPERTSTNHFVNNINFKYDKTNLHMLPDSKINNDHDFKITRKWKTITVNNVTHSGKVLSFSWKMLRYLANVTFELFSLPNQLSGG